MLGSISSRDWVLCLKLPPWLVCTVMVRCSHLLTSPRCKKTKSACRVQRAVGFQREQSTVTTYQSLANRESTPADCLSVQSPESSSRVPSTSNTGLYLQTRRLNETAVAQRCPCVKTSQVLQAWCSFRCTVDTASHHQAGALA
jgi:hypothetical protein